MMTTDGISRLLDYVGLRANMFYAGALCGLHDFSVDEGVGHLHVIRAGRVLASQAEHPPVEVREPTLLFYPRPCVHRLTVDELADADVLCASVRYDAGMENALTQSFPPVVVIPFNSLTRIEGTLDALFAEAAESRPGREVMLDRLCDVLLIQIARYVIEHDLVASGVLAGLAHPRLAKVLMAVLEDPGARWSVEGMAGRANLSRNAFAVAFRTVVGRTPLEFVTEVRIALAQRLLRQGKPVALVAQEVGYGSQPAFSRAFIRELAASPSEWVRTRAGATN